MTFVTRQMEISLRLASGSLNSNTDNVVNLAGHKCDLLIENAGSVLVRSLAQLRIYGMSQSDMFHFSTQGRTAIQQKNDEISISAGDSLSGIREVFSGTMNYAIVNMVGAPEISLEISAVPGFVHQMLPEAANSYPGNGAVADIIKNLAQRMGFGFENHGVTAQLSNHYLHGTAINQIEDVAKAAGIICCMERGVVKIWPNAGGQGGPVIDLSPSTGLIGYPTFNPYGITAEMEFRADLQVGRKINLTTSVPQASGEKFIARVSHELSTQTHQGPWKSTVVLTEKGNAIVGYR